MLKVVENMFRGALSYYFLAIFLVAFGAVNQVQAQSLNGTRPKCAQLGFKEHTKENDDCLKKSSSTDGSKSAGNPATAVIPPSTAKPANQLKPNAATAPKILTPRQIEDNFWKDATKRNTKKAYAGYLEKYPVGRYADLARTLLASLSATSAALAVPMPPTPQPPPEPPNAPPQPPTPPPAPPIGITCPVMVTPEMPKRALQDGTTGVVKAQIVLKGGAVQDVTILAGPRVFHAAVKAAIMQYKCVSNSAGAEVTMTQEFNFKID